MAEQMLEMTDSNGRVYKIYPPEFTKRRIDEILKANRRRELRVPLFLFGGFLIGQILPLLLRWAFS